MELNDKDIHKIYVDRNNDTSYEVVYRIDGIDHVVVHVIDTPERRELYNDLILTTKGR